MNIRIDLYHHFPPDDGLLTAIAKIQADVTTLLTRDEVPQEIADAIGDVQANVSDNFIKEQDDAQ